MRCIYKEGQKFPTPAVSDTARDFFMTLLEENPESRVATAWLVERGVLPAPKHGKLLKKYMLHKELTRQRQAEALTASPSKVTKAFPKRQSVNKKKLINLRQRSALRKR